MNEAKREIPGNEFWINTPSGKMYIKPYRKCLVITASGSAEAEVSELLGSPTGRSSSNSSSSAKWEVYKRPPGQVETAKTNRLMQFTRRLLKRA